MAKAVLVVRGKRRPEMARLVGLFTLFLTLFVAAGMLAL
jgi:hypothetical protein